MSALWSRVAAELRRAETDPRRADLLDEGQRRSLRFLADRLPRHGLVLADEVGTGKTRIACALVDAVITCGGRAVVAVPRGLLAQWRDESRTLRSDVAPRELTTWLEFLEEGSGQRAPGEWWLVSHGFRFPALQVSSPSWKFALPWLVLLAASEDERDDGRTRLARLWNQVDPKRRRWRGQWKIAQQMAKRLPQRLREELEALGLPDWESHENAELTELFSRRGDRGAGLRCVDALMRRWIGPVDLVVVDEAHKSRDLETDANPRTILSELLEYVLETREDSRRLCLTATPMELSVEQWAPLLHRARAEADHAKLERAVVGLKMSVRIAAEAPDEGARITALEEAACVFTTTLRPFVTRRRRREEPLLQDFGRHAPHPHLPHPHRNVEPVRIRWDTEVRAAGEEWRHLLIALEGIARSARGLSDERLGGTIKTLHTKLASGHVSLDLLDDARLSKLFEDDPTPHERRFLYWCREYESARRAQARAAEALGLDGYDPDAEHPRIHAAVRAIERWAAADPPEKVLCFGVFLRPLRLLRDVLNVRHALRCLDRGDPVTVSVKSLSAMAVRSYERMCANAGSVGGFVGVLRGAKLEDRVVLRQLEAAQRKYQNELSKVGREIAGEIDVELERHEIELGRVDRERLQAILRVIAAEARRAGSDGGEWRVELSRVLEGREEAEQDTDAQERLERWIAAEHAEEADSRVPSGFCRLLQGASEWATRRTLQAAFNRPGRFPMVLLAQSAVGREGLNLHKACRVVVQLHAEWNPAILEQQIGRVDRKGSLWESLATKWLKDPGRVPAPPMVEVRQIVFDGTYDAMQWERVGRRQHLFDAALFGSLLPLDAWLRATEDHRRRLEKAAPDFSPPALGPPAEP